MKQKTKAKWKHRLSLALALALALALSLSLWWWWLSSSSGSISIRLPSYRARASHYGNRSAWTEALICGYVAGGLHPGTLRCGLANPAILVD